MTHHTIEHIAAPDGVASVAVSYDREWNEYRARIVAPRGQINHDADYYTDSIVDARSTAAVMAEMVAARVAKAGA